MVATVVSLTSASSTVHYFRREGHGLGIPANENEAGDYYTRRDDEHRKASRWRGSGAAALGLSGHVEPGEFRRVLQGHVPGTDIRLGRLRDGEHEHRPGVDITLSAPKSVSLEALLGGPGSARAMRAHDAAVRATLDFVETRLLRTRRWSREERRSVQVNAPMLVAATFRHITSRNNDPQLHTHCVIANMTRDGGQWRSAEIGLLRRSEKLIGAFYRNELAHGLRKAGFALRPSMIGRVPGFEISGWPRAALEAFSSRRRQILDFIREKGWRYDARTAQMATLATRARKNEPRRAELEALWRDFAGERGLAKRTLRKIGVRRAEPPTALEIAWRVLEERASVFPAREALPLALAHLTCPGDWSAGGALADPTGQLGGTIVSGAGDRNLHRSREHRAGPFRRLDKVVVRQVGLACCGPVPSVPEHLSDQRQVLAHHDGLAGRRVVQVVQAKPAEPGIGADRSGSKRSRAASRPATSRRSDAAGGIVLQSSSPCGRGSRPDVPDFSGARAAATRFAAASPTAGARTAHNSAARPEAASSPAQAANSTASRSCSPERKMLRPLFPARKGRKWRTASNRPRSPSNVRPPASASAASTR